jgi:Spy/CpxP family protein refolding chaperone
MNKAWINAALSPVLLAVGAGCARAQQPYAGLEQRSIKALSDQQVADLRAGRGMGFALAAELNGYPGPVHVLELAEPLRLTGTQRARMTQLFEAMKVETMPLGEKLIAAEDALDQQFASKAITEATLRESVQSIASAQAALRAAHLKYHLAATEVLTPEQTARYGELRGYSAGTAGSHHHP